jgi:hypothetical protein
VVLGREIRRKTGLPLPLAMRAAKALLRGDAYKLVTDERFENLIVGHTTMIDQEEYSSWSIVGQRGVYDL